MSEINGWSPPLIFDLQTGTNRIVTQADVDALVIIRDAYGRLVSKVRAIQEDHDGVRDRVAALQGAAA